MSGPIEAVPGAGQPMVVRRIGLSSAADIGMERFARLAAGVMDVPVAVVALVEADRLVLPGLVGLDEPWAATREMPLPGSLCQRVVATGGALIAADARADDGFAATVPVPEREWGMLAYAAMPLSAAGKVVGALCAIDTVVRDWSDGQLRGLADLAAACSAELRLRTASQRALGAQHEAEDRRRDVEQEQLFAEKALAEAEWAGERARTGWDTAELLLHASQELAGTETQEDVQLRLRDLLDDTFKPVHVGLSLIQEGRLRSVPNPDRQLPAEADAQSCELGAAHPMARAARDRRVIAVADLGRPGPSFGEAAAAFARLGLRSVVCVPLVDGGEVLGVILVGWDQPRKVDASERAVLTAIGSYTAHAVQRAGVLDERVSVAHQLQRAMLTDLPAIPGLDLAALYLPAAAADLVGGDWYDAFLLPVRRSRADTGADAGVAVAVGDITGHDMQAATIMGQTRSMLRQAMLDRSHHGPAAAVTALEQACKVLDLNVTGTLLFGRLVPASAGWEFTWTNAGHPWPLLVQPDGRVQSLQEHDLLLHPGLDPGRRRDHRRRLGTGSVLLLYTDGLVDRRDGSIEETTEQVARTLAAHRHEPLPDLLNTLAAVAGPDPGDDIALLAVRVPLNAQSDLRAP
ncbi:GAF domain-containing SpoIIE family protein phosphatase [Nonomuraea sediminis]|uniref:GAF domain-containing SpoIIE family protein phosphatase n=1 Tax=Nonomuraea sediminis TaxID=2835864 RepID=UPI001BDD288E|nr:SpoIIE family protein phosphatase [Nonomuraea sediminis]